MSISTSEGDAEAEADTGGGGGCRVKMSEHGLLRVGGIIAVGVRNGEDGRCCGAM